MTGATNIARPSAQAQEWIDEDGVELRRMFAKLAARRWWLIAAVVLSTALFVTAALVMTPVFRSSAVLISASSERNSVSGSLNSALGQLGGLAALAGVGLGSSDAATEEALAVFKSREFTERFITDLNLLPRLFAKQWDAAAGQWRAPPKYQPTNFKGYKYFDRLRTITQDKKTGLVTLQIDWKDRIEGAAWANELARRLNDEMRTRAIEKADASVHYLEKELETTTAVDTRTAINHLIEAQIRQRMLANVTQEYAFRVVDRALPPDPDDPVRPQKMILFLLGPFVGLAVGIVAVLTLDLLFPNGSARRKRAAGRSDE